MYITLKIDDKLRFGYDILHCTFFWKLSRIRARFDNSLRQFKPSFETNPLQDLLKTCSEKIMMKNRGQLFLQLTLMHL